jgi:sialic acid synthase SpsE
MNIWNRLKENKPYYIADIGANHDGDIDRAFRLIELAKESGAHAAKFQNFKADTIVSDYGFKHLKSKTHQSGWKKSVHEVYKQAELNLEWTWRLKKHCIKYDIEYFTSPYDIGVVDLIDDHVELYKIGSGDITWLEMQTVIAKKNKPVLLATGASNIYDVERAVNNILNTNKKLVIMQCNTNYTVEQDKYRFVNLNVLDDYKKRFPGVPLGLSDHTIGIATVLGAIAKGAFIIEKHFTDDNTREGPDHAFAMNPDNWRQMVSLGDEIALALGDGVKRIEPNEIDARIVQQRSMRAARNIREGEILEEKDVIALRPCSDQAIRPYEAHLIIGKPVKVDLHKGQEILKYML